ncbi:MAG TPA: DsrE-related protein SaoD [Syntrophorhabdaceae bacterium]|nr:DsrE-related protein SaoD [Syntrophorhabdaceae bacterium]
MKVAYIMSSTNSQKILSHMILPQLEQGRHGAEILGIFFFMDNTYFLMKDTEMGERLQALHEKTGMIIMGCDQCVYERKIESLLVPGATLGCFPILYATLGSAGVEQVITL